MYKDSFQAFVQVVATWEGFEDFVPKIEYFAENLKKLGKESFVANKPNYGFNVLNHGDFHMRNILVQLNPEKYIDSFLFVAI